MLSEGKADWATLRATPLGIKMSEERRNVEAPSYLMGGTFERRRETVVSSSLLRHAEKCKSWTLIFRDFDLLSQLHRCNHPTLLIKYVRLRQHGGFHPPTLRRLAPALQRNPISKATLQIQPIAAQLRNNLFQ